MATRNNASARLRKTFHYPADGNDASHSEPEAMDEQEQESYIARLSAENTSRNDQFRQILVVLPLVSSLPYILVLFSSSSSSSSPLLCLLSLSSLASTTFILLRLPAASTGFPILDVYTSTSSTLSSRNLRRQRMRRESSSPLETWLPWLNLGLVAVLLLLGLVSGEAAWKGGFRWIGMGNLPGLVFAVVVVSKMVMGSVDPEAELGALKYSYKGA